MGYEYIVYNPIQDGDVLAGILKIHKTIFQTDEDIINKMLSKPKLFIITAVHRGNIIGYKVGYSIDRTKFYSWLGGINPQYRNQGIAKALMQKQHQYLKENGYEVVQTKTMNKWRNMLILNIKSGFDIINTYIDEEGLHKIVLEKRLDT